MNYKISKMQGYTLLEIAGSIDSRAVISAGSFIRELRISYPETVILDIDGLEEQREMFYHVALINSIKKVVEQSGGILKVRASGLPVKRYLSIMGLKKLFIFDDPVMSAGAEA